MRVAARRGEWSVPARLTTPVLLVVLCGLEACSLIAAPLPQDAEAFEPPAVYARWWAMTQTCSGRSANMADVRWYRVPGSSFIAKGQEAAGYASRYANRIVLAEDHIEQGPIVRHEMLHLLLRAAGHPRAPFLGSCAALVLCEGSCIDDAGRWQIPWHDYDILPPESLDLSSHAELLPPESDGQRWVALKITVRNPRAVAVMVAAPGDRVTPPTFGYDVRGFPGRGIGGGEVAMDSSTLFFEPFETKQLLFEFKVASDLSQDHIPPGKYLILGEYARRRTVYDTVDVSP
jgi:hypothetical protein